MTTTPLLFQLLATLRSVSRSGLRKSGWLLASVGLLWTALLLWPQPLVRSAALADGCFSGTFGSKMDVNLNRKKPAQIYLLGTKLRVSVRASGSTGRNYVSTLQSQVESGLLGGDKRFSLDAANPETLIQCDISGVESSEKWESRTTKEQKKVGEQQVYNEKKQKYETKDVYKEVEVTRRYQVVTGKFFVNYTVTDAQTHQSLGGSTASAFFDRSYENGEGAPTLAGVEQGMLYQAAVNIYRPMLPTMETVKVLLPQCKLKDTSRLGEAGLWARMLEAFEKMPPLKRPEDDAYRYYAIGLAYEALAYQAENLATTQKMLEDAAVNYSKAFDAKLEEKYFREPQIRVETAIKQYQTIAEQEAAYSKKLASKSLSLTPPPQLTSVPQPTVRPQPTPVPTTPPPVNGALTNQQIVNLAKSGMGEDNLLRLIQHAPAVQFDMRPESLQELLSNKVSNNVIAAMFKRMAPSPPKPNSTPKPPSKRKR